MHSLTIIVIGHSYKEFDNCENVITLEDPSINNLKDTVSHIFSKYTLFVNNINNNITILPGSIERLKNIAKRTKSKSIYSDYANLINGKFYENPLLKYQIGSLRDDFDFGPLILIQSDILKNCVRRLNPQLRYSTFYELRLMISEVELPYRLPEILSVIDKEKSDNLSQFSYQKKENKNIQLEKEEVCNNHLKRIGAWLLPNSQKIDFSIYDFNYEASIIIPVKNRAATIKDAIVSAINQKTNFKYNIIVVDNYSTDGTSEIIKELADSNKKIIHIIPDCKYLGIGGCWNEAINSKHCGKFAVQLDSDDLYLNEHTLQKIIDKFNEDKCGVVVGSYTIVNFKLEEIPPGTISHDEWTMNNGHNNALRINGFGAPRAFYTPLVRKIKFPNVNYGEDYALMLEITGKYRLSRIFESIYLCRRWDGNSDSNIDIITQNNHNRYKDTIRTIEIQCRRKRNHRI